ncbi:MAG: type VI secretion system protein ImpA [Candidatus Paceibacteria bacterium]|jgi:type VI secretion system protein ImpA
MRVIDVDALLLDVDTDAPCGLNLEYDPAFLELEQAVLGKPEVQYGDSITPAVPPDWKVVKRLATSLLERSRDLRVIVPLLRALLALHGMPALADCLHLIERLLDERWDSVHPQLDPDDDLDPMLRINSLAILNDGVTVLREVREATFIVLPGLGPISVRDLEIASGELTVPEGQTKLGMASIEAALRDVEAAQLISAADAMRAAFDSTRNIETLLVRQVGSSQALNLDMLTRMLGRARDLLAGAGGDAVSAVDVDAVVVGTDQQTGSAVSSGPRAAAISGEVASREDVLRMLDKICGYYARNEPSSPVPLLLERAKRLVPKNFFEIMQDLAPDGMSQLSVISGVKPEEDSSY